MLARAVIGLSWSLEQKRNGTEPTPTNQTDPGIDRPKKWWSISVIQYFVPTVPSREENYEAKEEARTQYTSMVVMITSSFFSAQWFLRISSVPTKQWEIFATKYQRFWGSGETCSTWSFGNDGDSCSPFCRRNSDQCTATFIICREQEGDRYGL